jgi:hypothetical protein
MGKKQNKKQDKLAYGGPLHMWGPSYHSLHDPKTGSMYAVRCEVGAMTISSCPPFTMG